MRNQWQTAQSTMDLSIQLALSKRSIFIYFILHVYVCILTVYFDTLESTLYIIGFSRKPESNVTALFE